LDTLKSYKEINDPKGSVSDPNRPFPVDNNIFMEEKNTMNGGKPTKFYRGFKRNDREKEPRKKKKEYKTAKKQLK
jgi:hypothetical protein